jgi:hypothetical protein
MEVVRVASASRAVDELHVYKMHQDFNVISWLSITELITKAVASNWTHGS